MGDWKYVNGGWEYDPGAPDADPTVTSMLPVYAGSEASPVITESLGPLDLIDNLCEDRHLSELSNEDGVD